MPLGLQRDHVTFATTDTNLAGYKDSAPVQQRLLDAVRRIPGVERRTGEYDATVSEPEHNFDLSTVKVILVLLDETGRRVANPTA